MEISKCRVCAGTSLSEILNLGCQVLTGIFPLPNEEIDSSLLELFRCENCGLVQLKHSYDSNKMYSDSYGYRSGLNASMVGHLAEIESYLTSVVSLSKGDVVLDIGSNDGTLLGFYDNSLTRIGIDPTGEKFKKYYQDGIVLIPEFFSSKIYHECCEYKAKVVSSIAMFYDLEDPIKFAKEVASVLHEDGIWLLEQSYLPSMLKANAYDTICHEHLEYYSLSVVDYILKSAGMKIINVTLNDTNGGSFAVTATHETNTSFVANTPVIGELISKESEYLTPQTYLVFKEDVYKHKEDLLALLTQLKSEGKLVLGYGASTKGNVILQHCWITQELLLFIAEVNPDKYRHVTPGTKIPIISEEEAKAMNPDFFLVFPWHFKKGILEKEEEYRASGGKFIFPLPRIEIL